MRYQQLKSAAFVYFWCETERSPGLLISHFSIKQKGMFKPLGLNVEEFSKKAILVDYMIKEANCHINEIEKGKI